MRRSTEIFWQTLAAVGVGAIAYSCVLEAEISTAPMASPSAAVRGLAGGVAVVSAGIAAFMTGCMFRDPDSGWSAPPARRPMTTGSGHDIDTMS